jgi:glutamine phosphoribosylpyrophosphate amidotransferase
MCGIFGIGFREESKISPREFRNILDHLFCYSQSRGKEASGLLFKQASNLVIHKATISGDKLIKTQEYKNLFECPPGNNSPSMVIGHARLDTNGSKWDNSNNSPLIYGDIYGIHNGIITNVDSLWKENPQLDRHHVVDSEVLLALFYENLQHGDSEDLAIQKIFSKIEGSASVALYAAQKETLTLATNTGSLYFSTYGDSFFVFASESYILEQLHKKISFLRRLGSGKMQQILPRTSLTLDIKNLTHAPYRGRVVHEIL